MWSTYQKIGFIGGVITLIVAILLPFLATVGIVATFRAMAPHAMRTLSVAVSGFSIIGIIAGILGIIGSRVGNNVAAGTLMIIGAILSTPMLLGAFGVGFILMLVGGVLALTYTSRPRERVVEQKSAPAAPPPPP